MSKIRSVKPDLWLDYDLAKLGFAARYFFIGLFTQADREGRLEYAPERLQAQLLPWDQNVSVKTLLSELSPKFVQIYAVNDRNYIEIVNFTKHQRPHHTEKRSAIPRRRIVHGELTVNSPLTHGESPEGKEGKGRERNGRELNIVGQANQKEGVVISEPKSGPKQLTPIQVVVRAFKIAKGVDPNDKEWDKKFFPRYSRPAKDLLEVFNGDADKAAVYMLTKGEEWVDLKDWGIEAVIKSVARDYAKFKTELEGENGYQHREMGQPRILEHGGRSRITPVGNLASDALEEIGVRREKPSGLESPTSPAGVEMDAENGGEVFPEPFLAGDDEGRVNEGREDQGV